MGQSDADVRSAAANGFVSLGQDFGVTDGFEGVIDSATGEITDGGNNIGLVGIEDVVGADAAGEGKFRRQGVDGDDR